jgi:hypothetical protein
MVSSPFTPAERLASLKVALIGGGSAAFLSLIGRLAHNLAGPSLLPAISTGFSSLVGLTLLVNTTIALLSGALFALTYRYAIRQDTNRQLQLGVVLAFTLVRGLAQVDASSAIAQHWWPFATACGESLWLFGGTAIVLFLGFQQNWLTPFGKS